MNKRRLRKKKLEATYVLKLQRFFLFVCSYTKQNLIKLIYNMEYIFLNELYKINEFDYLLRLEQTQKKLKKLEGIRS